MFSQAIDSFQPQNTLRDLLEFDFSWKYVLHIIFEISRPFFAGGKNEQHEQWVYKSCFNVHPCQQSHILWRVHMFLPHIHCFFLWWGIIYWKMACFTLETPHTTIGSVKTYKKAKEGNKTLLLLLLLLPTI